MRGRLTDTRVARGRCDMGGRRRPDDCEPFLWPGRSERRGTTDRPDRLARPRHHPGTGRARRRTQAGTAVTFNGATATDELSRRILDDWSPMLERLPYTPDTDWEAFEPYTAEAMTRRQVEVFDRVVS